MTVFKTFLKLVNKNKGQLILYTVLLITFTCLSLSNNDTNINYTDSKPNVIIIDKDKSKLSKNLVKYFDKNAKLDKKDLTESDIEDKLFYRFTSFVIYIPEGFEKSVISGDFKTIDYKSTDDYGANLASILLNKYLNTITIYRDMDSNIDYLISHVDKSLNNKIQVEVNSKLNTDELAKVKFYYSFMNYSLLAGCIYVLVVIISIFREKNILKRNAVSSMNYNTFNRNLLLSSLLFGFLVWAIYIGISFIIIGNIMTTSNCLLMIAVSFLFLIYCLAVGFLIANLVNNKGAINGIINVIALGSSFLCGAFVSLEFLPDNVLRIAKFIPNYYYIDAINKLASIENISIGTLKPIFSNIIILLVTSIILIIISMIISKRKRKLA